MTKTKKPAARGPKLFGTVAPSSRPKRNCAIWEGNGCSACVAKHGRTFSAFYLGETIGTAYATFATAKRAIEDRIADDGECAVAFGWEPKR